jgi:hypothetical protein
VPAGIFPKLCEERSSLLFRAKVGRGTFILNYLGKGKERLSHTWSLRAGQEVALQPLGDTRECPGQNTFYGLNINFPFHQLFLDILLSKTDLERERESLRRGEKILSALKSGFAHVALAVWYKPPAGI